MKFLIRPLALSLSRWASAGGMISWKIWFWRRDKIGKTDDR